MSGPTSDEEHLMTCVGLIKACGTKAELFKLYTLHIYDILRHSTTLFIYI